MGKARRIASIVRGHADGICYAPRVHFGVWHPIGDAGIVAPEGSGVLQARAEGVMDYETGRSAMVFYACSPPGETLRGFVGGRGARQLRRAVAAGARRGRLAAAPPPTREAGPPPPGVVGPLRAPPPRHNP